MRGRKNKNGNSVKMDIELQAYLRYNKFLMYIIGQWPHQSTLEKILVSLVYVPIIMGQLVLQSGGALCAYTEVDIFMEGIAPVIISLMCLTKYINHICNYDQMKELLFTMEKDWDFYKKYKREREIFSHYYEIGEKATFGYAASMYGTMMPFMVLPAMVHVASNMGLINTTDTKPTMFRVDYFVDADTYYYPLLIHSYFGTLGYITVVVALDGMIVFYVQHNSALCEILGEKLEAITNNDDLNIDFNSRHVEDETRQRTKACIILHNHIIDIASRIDKANRMSFVLQLGFNMIGISFTGFQATVKLNTPEIALRYACFTTCLTYVLFLESWPGQQLIDHTDRLTEYIVRAKWYQISKSARKDVIIMLMRSLIPIKLTAGKIYTLNFQNFSAVVRTSFSYFTVLCSMQ